MNDKIKQLVRPNIIKMDGYKSARDEYTDNQGTFLDANESPYGINNRYPDPYQNSLKAELSVLKSINPNQIFIGNGSDEIIDLLFRVFCTPMQDKCIAFSPGYGMYKVSASIQDIEYIDVKLTNSFQIDKAALEPFFEYQNIKIIFICSPNNPTGNIIDHEDIEWILKTFKGIVVIDEAYIDFTESDSWITKMKKYDRLVILQTMSKAWGLAGARVGMAYTHPAIVTLLNKVKPPYNVSTLNQTAALQAINNSRVADIQMKAIITERKRIYKALNHIESIKRVYPSESNFILIEVDDANALYHTLIKQKIIVRNQSNKIKGCLRLSIGTPEENEQLLDALRNTNTQPIPFSEYGLTNNPDLINRH